MTFVNERQVHERVGPLLSSSSGNSILGSLPADLPWIPLCLVLCSIALEMVSFLKVA